jgi:hypothetical protein
VRRLAARARAIRREHGLAGVLVLGAEKLWVLASYPVQRVRWARRTFGALGSRHAYFIHHYNVTWQNERAVEVAVALDFVQRCRGGEGLELGNVLPYYTDVSHTVVDKYERGPRIVNADAAEYRPTSPLDYIVSVSTFEHVGWDEEPRDPSKAEAAVQRLRTFLAPGGTMLLTVPLGHNPGLDDAIRRRRFEPRRQSFLKRSRGGWAEVDDARAFDEAHMPPEATRFGRNPPTRAVWIAELGPS